LELADSLDERKALRIELREIRRQLFETPQISIKEQNNNSIIVTSKTTVTTSKVETDSNNNNMTLNSQDSSISINGNATDRAARRARRAQHMKSLSEESKPAVDVITQNKTGDKPEVSPPKKQISVEITDTTVKTSSTNNKTSIGIKTESIQTSTTITTNSTTKPSFNASNSPGLRRTATWSPKDRVNSSTANKVNQFTANKTKFGAQETPSTVDKSSNRLSLQPEKSINGLTSNRDKSPNRLSLQDKSPTPNRLSLREKSPSRFDTNRDKSPNRFSSQDKSSNRLGAQKPQERPKSVGPETIFSGVSNNATDRMAMFREAAEKEKRDKERQEERKRNAEEFAAKAAAESKRKAEEKKKQEEEEKIRKEKEAKEEPKEEMKDSERMKYAAPCMKKREKKKVVRRTMSISSIVLDWVQEMIKDYPVEVRNFSSSWNDGMAFCALIHHFNPEEFDYSELKAENKRHNFDLAFETGLKCKNIPILLDTEDMVRMAKPEPRSVQCYIQWVWSVYGPTSGYGPTPKEVQTASVS